MLTLFEKDSDGQKPALTTYYDLAVLYPEAVIKADGGSLVSNPLAQMHMAFPTPGQGGRLCDDLWSPVASNGEYRIWFLRRDMILTGHYFIRGAQDVTEGRVKEIKTLVATQQRPHNISLVVADPDGEIRVNGEAEGYDAGPMSGASEVLCYGTAVAVAPNS